MILQKDSGQKKNAWQSHSTENLACEPQERGRMVQNCETESYCRNHTVFLASSNGFFHQKEKRILWPSSGNLRFSMPSRVFHTQLPVKATGEADLFHTGTRREGLQGQKHSELLQEALRWECSLCQFSIEFQPHCVLNFLYLQHEMLLMLWRSRGGGCLALRVLWFPCLPVSLSVVVSRAGSR